MNTLDPLIEGYLTYLQEVGRKAPRTVIDVRCTLKRAVESFATRRPGVSLWKLALEDYLRWFEAEREGARSNASLAKDASHLRGLLEYAWRSGRSERNVLDGLNLHESVRQRAPNFLTLEQAERLVAGLSAPYPCRAARSVDHPAALRLRAAHCRAVRARCGRCRARAPGAHCASGEGRSPARAADPRRRLQ